MKFLVYAALLCYIRTGLGLCINDGITYTEEGTYNITNKPLYNFCRTSYVEANVTADFVVLLFKNISMDCQDAYLKVYSELTEETADYCKTTKRNDTFLYASSRPGRITIDKLGFISATLQIQFSNSSDTATSIPPTAEVTNPSPPVQSTVKPASPTCGIPGIKPNEMGLKVIGGQPAIPRSWPWQVALFDGGILCGGSLINNQWIVTAAHCGFYVNTLFAHLGEFDSRNLTDDILRVKVEKLVKHPMFGNPYNRFKNDWDIALIKLRVPIMFSEFISPVCLPGGRIPLIGQTGITTGWGMTAYNQSSSPILMQTTITVMRNLVCSPGNELTSRQICAGELNPVHSSCHGDSGGPFVLKESETGAYWMAGVVSSGYDKCQGRTIYTSTVQFEDWIKETISNN